ncbi:uncharacterized protein [Dermacentor albipictus]|uniref:uncharacterized protein n=1 Tax=Dermacentor albipictus TaxID=60249 RepID=UPI0038FC6F58
MWARQGRAGRQGIEPFYKNKLHVDHLSLESASIYEIAVLSLNTAVPFVSQECRCYATCSYYCLQTCRLNQREGEVSAACHFDIKNGEVQYYGQMSYRQPVVQTFSLYALIKEFPIGDHMNPASLTMIVYFKNGTAGKVDIRECLITDFMLTTVTIPPFWLFGYSDFKNNVTLAAAVWDEFQVYMFTHVRLIAKNAIKDACIKQLKSKRIRTST